jgi:hypothetical protein
VLKEDLKDWQDIDAAGFILACDIGLMKKGDFQVKAKHVFWSNNAIGNVLYDILDKLVEIGVLENDTEELRYRWNPLFKGDWECQE